MMDVLKNKLVLVGIAGVILGALVMAGIVDQATADGILAVIGGAQ